MIESIEVVWGRIKFRVAVSGYRNFIGVQVSDLVRDWCLALK